MMRFSKLQVAKLYIKCSNSLFKREPIANEFLFALTPAPGLIDYDQRVAAVFFTHSLHLAMVSQTNAQYLQNPRIDASSNFELGHKLQQSNHQIFRQGLVALGDFLASWLMKNASDFSRSSE